MRPLFMRPGLIPKVLNRLILRGSRSPFVPLVAVGVFASAAALIWAESRVKDKSPVVLERLEDRSICPDEGSSFRVEDDFGFEGGNAEWEKGRPAAAIHKWTQAALGYSGWEWPLPALLRVARAAAKHGDQTEAIAAYKKVIETPISSPVNPPDPGELPGNSKHVACVALSDIFLERHDLQQALKYSKLAQDVHKFSSPWEAANQIVDSCLQVRIDAIESALLGGRNVVLEPRSTVLAHFHGERRGPPLTRPVGRLR
ncbi:MAG TPA: hypothetical protein VFG04_29140 [Planctomycetaceae bacterium]|nr:hypothetical protein [Planctomycetaceae bacterium]